MSYLVTNPKGATVTVFAPYDCKNNCPFCVNKKEYQENPSFDLEAVKESMALMNEITSDCDFVITGGEPLAAMTAFLQLVRQVQKFNEAGAHHKLFVNTTLPVEEKDIQILNKYTDVITGFNISRHIGGYIKESDRELVNKLRIPVRINCVLYKKEDVDGVPRFIDKWGDYPIQFREDYSGIYPYNVHHSSAIFDKFCEKFPYEYEGFEPQLKKDTFRWSLEIAPDIYYHRTACFSTVWTKDGHQIINDVIIDTRGEILSDWNGYGEKLKVLDYYDAMKDAERMSKVLGLIIDKKI